MNDKYIVNNIHKKTYVLNKNDRWELFICYPAMSFVQYCVEAK